MAVGEISFTKNNAQTRKSSFVFARFIRRRDGRQNAGCFTIGTFEPGIGYGTRRRNSPLKTDIDMVNLPLVDSKSFRDVVAFTRKQTAATANVAHTSRPRCPIPLPTAPPSDQGRANDPGLGTDNGTVIG